MRLTVLIALSALPFGVAAETITLELEDGSRFLRCTDSFGHASCEVLLAEPENIVNCVAFDAAQEPVALSAPFPNGIVIFNDLDANTVADVRCRTR